jgi:hypothetical protein
LLVGAGNVDSGRLRQRQKSKLASSSHRPNEQLLADRRFQSSRFGEGAIADGVRLKSRPEGCAELSWLWKPNCTVERVQSLLLALRRPDAKLDNNS